MLSGIIPRSHVGQFFTNATRTLFRMSVSLLYIIFDFIDSCMILIFIGIIFVVILMYAWVKIKYPFWSSQPVRHKYDLSLFCTNTIRPLKKTKFYDNFLVKSYKYFDLADQELEVIMDFVRCHWIPSDRVVVSTEISNLGSYTSALPSASVVSVYKENDINGIKGIVVSRPYFIDIHHSVISCCIADIISVHRDELHNITLKGKLLETHFINQSMIHDNNTCVTLFKKEGAFLDGVVPLVTYKSVLFDIRDIHVRENILPLNIQCTEMDANLCDIFLEQSRKHMSVVGYSNLYHLIKAKEVYGTCLRQGSEIYAFYIFKNMLVHYEHPTLHGGDTLGLIASIRPLKSNTNLFFIGFIASLQMIQIKHLYRVLIIEGLGHNPMITDLIRRQSTPIYEYDSAYYLHNCILKVAQYPDSSCIFI